MANANQNEVMKVSYDVSEVPRIDEAMAASWTRFLQVSPKTVSTYTKAVKQFFLFMRENEIQTPTREDLLSFRESLICGNKKPSTIQLYMTAVKGFFNWMTETYGYPDITKRVKGAKIDTTQHKKSYLTPAQMKNVLSDIDRSTLAGKRDYAMIWTMVTTGLRTVSIVRADIEDISAAGDCLALWYQGKGHTEKDSFVKLCPEAEAALSDYLKARGKKTGVLFASEAHQSKSGRMATGSVSRIVKTAFRKAGYDSGKLTAHSLRHTAATLNLMNGGTVEETQQLLGHKNINTTMIYSHTLDRIKNQSESRIGEAIVKA